MAPIVGPHTIGAVPARRSTADLAAPRPRRHRVVVLAVSSLALAVLGAGCATGSTDARVSLVRTETLDGPAPDGSDDGETNDGGTAISWESCGDRLDCATLAVPLNRDEPDGDQFELRLVRHRASRSGERIGSLLVNPGGPGSDGTWLAEQAELLFGDRLLDRFDIVAWDPRGTGRSTPFVDCVDSYDPYFAHDMSPDSPEDKQVADEAITAFAEACSARTGNDVLAHISTAESAADMDAIRRALGEDTISYFGFSYGSELGATWATLFPDTVRAAVLDGAADPTASDVESTLQQAAGFEAALDRFLAECASDRGCPFNNRGDPQAAFDELMAELDESPLEVEPDRAPVNQTVALTAVANAMYNDVLWPELAQALTDAQAGDGTGLLAGFDDYYQRRSDGTYDNLLEAFNAITCLDADPDPSTESDEAIVEQIQQAAPRLWPVFAGESVCSAWPVEPAGRVAVTGAGAGPIVVVGTTGDPATPLESSRAMAEALEQGVFVIVEADQHTGYNVNECVNDAIEDYLVDLVVPEDGLVCS